jgi:hypothetical protein
LQLLDASSQGGVDNQKVVFPGAIVANMKALLKVINGLFFSIFFSLIYRVEP